MVSGQRVLVVDGLSETEQVLRAVLEPRGMQIDRIRSGREDIAEHSDRPSVIVLHMEHAAAAKPAVREDDVPRVIIGTAELPSTASSGDEYLEHPFQYGELIRAIERLIDHKAA